MMEKKIYQILEWSLWVLNPFLLVLAIYNDQIQPPLLLLWIGRFHPLALHFPIVFGMLVVIYLLFFQHRRFSAETERLLLAINAFLASVVVICGILLSRQNGYDAELITMHKWGGIVVAFLSWLFVYILDFKLRIKKILSLIFLILLIGSAHKGAQLTHGVNALSFPSRSTEEGDNNTTEEINPTVYEAGIAPILAGKCTSCHGDDKVKGNLKLNTPENILKGGKNGNLLKGAGNDLPLLLTRLHLPLTDEKHMPPDGKMQLTTEEMALLTNWINGGCDFKIRVGELPVNDTRFPLPGTANPESVQKNRNPGNLPDLAEFNSNYCTTDYLYNGTDEVAVNFFQGSFYSRENLKKLEKIKNQVVRLNLQGMPLKEEDLDLIVQFKNLQKLNINYSGLQFASLEMLKSLKKLKSISICGLDVDEVSLDKFLDQSNLSNINVWTKNGNEKQFEKIASKYPSIKIVTGDNLEGQLMKISNPAILQDSLITINHLDVKLKHLLNGVILRYTTDGTDPDSLNGTVYKDQIRLSENTVLKVRAFKPGWISSDLVQRTFYKSEIHPDTIFLITEPDSKHRANGAKTLIDYDLGENNRYTDKWLGYKDSSLEFVIGFNQPRLLNKAYLNAYVELGPSIFPITAITVQGSNDGRNYSKIAETRFPPAKNGDPSGARPFICDFSAGTTFKYYRFVVANLKRMPAWKKENSGKPAWIFIDELFLN